MKIKMKLSGYPDACYYLFLVLDKGTCVWPYKIYKDCNVAKRSGLLNLVSGKTMFAGWSIDGFRICCMPSVDCDDKECDIYDFDKKGECVGIIKGVR